MEMEKNAKKSNGSICECVHCTCSDCASCCDCNKCPCTCECHLK